jgi:hypothetical protein
MGYQTDGEQGLRDQPRTEDTGHMASPTLTVMPPPCKLQLQYQWGAIRGKLADDQTKQQASKHPSVIIDDFVQSHNLQQMQLQPVLRQLNKASLPPQVCDVSGGGATTFATLTRRDMLCITGRHRCSSCWN